MVFISYSHDSVEHKDAILALSEQLRQEGVDCIIDQYEESPEEGWPRWCERQVTQARFVLVACTETYRRRFDAEEEPRRGLGGTWESNLIIQELQNAQGRNAKYIPITFCSEDSDFIPLSLQGAQVYRLYEDYEALYRRLTGQPAILKSSLGSVLVKAPRLPPQPKLARKQDFEPVWHLPYRRNEFFTGREDVLDGLRKALDRRGIAALSGLGGLGKTQNAIEYAYRYREGYKAVLWVEAESVERLLASFASIAATLDLSSAQPRDQQQAVSEVYQWLKENPKWLLIFDNADTLSLVKDYLPRQTNGHVLLTTREQAVRALAEPVAVKKMASEEGALLLLRRTGLLAKDRPLSDAREEDRRAAVELSKELGGLPLALDQAGAFIEAMRLSVFEYVRLYASEKASLLAERGALGEHLSVAVTFSLAFQKVAGKNAAAGDMIRLCAFLAPDAIPEEIFTGGDVSGLGEELASAVTSPLSFAKMVGEACRFSLLERDAANGTLDIHRLVQVVIKAGMSEPEQKVWAERAVRATAKVFPAVEFVNWPACQRLIAHCQSHLRLIEEWEFASEEAARLLNLGATYLFERALYGEAEPLYERSLAIRKKAMGESDPSVATSLNNLAALYRIQGRYAEAEPLYQRSLSIREESFGPDHPEVAASLNNLAMLYHSQGRYAENEPLSRRSLAILERTLGTDHPHVAISLQNLAALYRSQGRFAEAEPLYQRSLAIRKKALGPEHPDVANSLNNLAALYDSLGRYGDAEPLYLSSLAIWEKALGPDHPSVATSLSNLALLYDSQGRYGEAEPLYRRSLAIREKTLGPNHPSVATSLNNLAGLYDYQGRYADAEPLYQRSLVIRDKTLGPDHPKVAACLNNLAELYDKQERYADAEPLRLRALAIEEKTRIGSSASPPPASALAGNPGSGEG